MSSLKNTCFVQLAGGLGNQLFQIATAFAHCKKNDYTLAISNNTQGGRPTYWDSFLHNLSIYKTAKTSTIHPIWEEPYYHYCPIPHNSLTLKGYFQSSKYFNDAAEDIKHLFTSHPQIINLVNEKYNNLVTPHSFAIHVRRGDYLDATKLDYHFVTTPEYFDRAITKAKELDPSASFVVFSEDIPWCRAQPYFTDATFVDERDECVTLELMSRFQNYIISNSSFSWWSVWLGTPARVVIAPNMWFGPRGPQDYEDIYEPEWIRVPV